MVDRVTFACSVCKFRSFYHEDMAAHLESKFHKDHFKFLSSQLSKPTTDFLQVDTHTHTIKGGHTGRRMQMGTFTHTQSSVRFPCVLSGTPLLLCVCVCTYQEYLNNKYKKTEQRTSQMENHCAAICQVYKEQDLTRRKDSSVFMWCLPGFLLVANSRLLPAPPPRRKQRIPL